MTMRATLLLFSFLLLSSSTAVTAVDQSLNASQPLLQEKLRDSHWNNKDALSRIVGGTPVQRSQFSYFSKSITKTSC